MYLFTRMTRLTAAHAVDGMEWAIGVTEKVNQITSLDMGLWSPMLSPGVGTLSWGATVESLGDLEDAEAKLMADSMFVDLTQRGATMTDGSLEDETGQFVHGGTDPGFDPTHVAVVRSQLANGNFGRGVAASIEIAQKATELSGLLTSLLIATTGPYAGVTWITGAPSLRDLEKGENAANMNPDFVALVDRVADCFLPAVTTQSIWRRIV